MINFDSTAIVLGCKNPFGSTFASNEISENCLFITLGLSKSLRVFFSKVKYSLHGSAKSSKSLIHFDSPPYCQMDSRYPCGGNFGEPLNDTLIEK